MKSENLQAYLVTVPYNDLRAMEAQAEALSEIKTQLTILLTHPFMNKNIKYNIEPLLEIIREAQQT